MSTSQPSSGFDQYKKTCSIIFGKATASQLRYLNAFVDFQQAAFSSCDGIIANQLKWLENYVDKNKNSLSGIDVILKNYTSIVTMDMNLFCIFYDYLTLNLESITKSLGFLNQYFFEINKDQGELEGVPISES